MMGIDSPILHLLPRHLGMVQALLQHYLPDAEVWAYGSRVTGTGHEASDLDLVVRHPTNLDADLPGIARLKEAFLESDLPIRVEVMEWSRLPKSFHRNMAVHVVVQGQGKGVS